jgi:MFS family permease
MQLLSVVVTIGVIIQTAAVNIGMFIAGRAIAGLSVGGMYATVPIYLSEVAPPNHRGMIAGLAGLGISCGSMIANWIGFSCGYAPYGQVQWRLPLGLQMPWGVVLFIGLATFMPNSPRSLIRHGRVDAAREAFQKIRTDLQSDEAQHEFALMKAQIEFEREREITSYKEVFQLYRHRALW